MIANGYEVPFGGENVLKLIVVMVSVRNTVNVLKTTELYTLNGKLGTSLEAQWLRIHLPTQGTWV